MDANPLEIFKSGPSEMDQILFEHFHMLWLDHEQTFSLQGSGESSSFILTSFLPLYL